MRTGWAHLVGLVAFGLMSLLLYLSPPSGISMDVLGNALQVVAAALGFAYTLRAARAFAPEDQVRPGWLLLAAGHGFSFLAFLLYALLELGGSTDLISSYADVLWVVSNTFVLAALAVIAREYRRSGLPVASGGSAWLITLGSLAVFGWMLIWPMWVQQGQEQRLVELLLLIYYPVFDALLLGGAWYMARMLYPLGRGALSWPWMAIVAGLVVTAVSDAAYAMLNLHGFYETGNLIDLGWVFYGLLMALGGYIQHRLMTADLGLKRREVAT